MDFAGGEHGLRRSRQQTFGRKYAFDSRMGVEKRMELGVGILEVLFVGILFLSLEDEVTHFIFSFIHFGLTAGQGICASLALGHRTLLVTCPLQQTRELLRGRSFVLMGWLIQI